MNYRDIGAEQMIEIWALRSTGKPLTDPTAVATGGEPGVDAERLITLYVELVPGFDSAREALRWVYILGRSPSEFPLRRPGESYGQALIRRGWGMHLGKAPCAVCAAVVNDFIKQVEARMSDSPLSVPVSCPTPDAEDIAASVGASHGEVRTW